MSGINTNITDHLPMIIGTDDRLRGALAYKDVDQSVSNNVLSNVLFPLEVYDTDNFHELGINNGRFTIPAGVNRIRLRGNVVFDTFPGGDRVLEFRKNTSVFIGAARIRVFTALSVPTLNGLSAVVDCVEDDFFNLRVLQDSGFALDVLADSGFGTWFSIEVMEAA